MLKNYIKVLTSVPVKGTNTSRRVHARVGLVISEMTDDFKVVFGWSLCHELDKFCKDKANKIAEARMGKSGAFPKSPHDPEDKPKYVVDLVSDTHPEATLMSIKTIAKVVNHAPYGMQLESMLLLHLDLHKKKMHALTSNGSLRKESPVT
jgi:hypothetical protein